MKTFTITGRKINLRGDLAGEIGEVVVEGEDLQCSDGYHKMSEVYNHRLALFAALLRTLHYLQPMADVWKSKHHSDCIGPISLTSRITDDKVVDDCPDAPCCSMFPGWFVAGVGVKPGEQITYHLPLAMFNDLLVPELEKAPAWDGHTSAQVLERLKLL